MSRKPAGPFGGAVTIETDATFPRLAGRGYRGLLAELHTRHVVDWYLEIGCRTGRSLSAVRAKTVAIDPFFRIGTDVLGAKPELHLLQATSAEVFAELRLERMGVRPALSFIDGMHLIEAVLDDLIGVEAVSRPGGVILIHDAVPGDLAMTTRDVTGLPKGAPWTGDVWKILPILAEWRPDLRVEVFDARPTGLVAVSRLDPGNRTLARNRKPILRDWQNRTLDRHGVGDFFAGFDLLPATSDGRLDRLFAEAVAAAPVAASADPEWVSP